MLSLLSKINLIDGLIGLVTVSLILLKASWPLAVVFIVLGALKGYREHLASVKLQEKDDAFKERVIAMENKMAMLGLRK